MVFAAAPQLLDNPCCDVINRVPWSFFMVVHIALFAVAIVFALRASQAGHNVFGVGFALFAVAELSYMTYHVNATLFLFAHTISEVLVGAGLATLFLGLVRSGVLSQAVEHVEEPERSARTARAR